MRWFWSVYWPVIVIIALALGLTAQFAWKMVYFPEPVAPVIIELAAVWAIAGIAVWGELRDKTVL